MRDAWCSWTRWVPTPRSHPCMAGHGAASGRALRRRATLREEHDAAGEHEFGGYGPYPGSARLDENKAVFEAYVEWVLAPSLKPGQVVVMDNLARPIRARR